MMRNQPASDLEIYELFCAAYPERFNDDESEGDEVWDAVEEFAENLSGFDDISDLIGRLVMLAMPMESGLTKRRSHCLGKITIGKDGNAYMVAGIRRDCTPTSQQGER
jgi:hypothetical protein